MSNYITPACATLLAKHQRGEISSEALFAPFEASSRPKRKSAHLLQAIAQRPELRQLHAIVSEKIRMMADDKAVSFPVQTAALCTLPLDLLQVIVSHVDDLDSLLALRRVCVKMQALFSHVLTGNPKLLAEYLSSSINKKRSDLIGQFLERCSRDRYETSFEVTLKPGWDKLPTILGNIYELFPQVSLQIKGVRKQHLEAIEAVLASCPFVKGLELPDALLDSKFYINPPISSELEEFTASNTELTNQGLESITTLCTKLQRLNINSCSKIEARSLKLPTLSTALTELNLWGMRGATDSLLQNVFSRARQLRALSLPSGPGITASFWAVSDFPKKLTALDLRFSTIPQEGLSHLFQVCTELVSLDLRYCTLAPSAYVEVAFPARLRTLILRGNTITGTGLHKVLGSCLALENLDLQGCVGIAREAFLNAPYPSPLKTIDVLCTNIDASGHAALKSKGIYVMIF